MAGLEHISVTEFQLWKSVQAVKLMLAMTLVEQVINKERIIGHISADDLLDCARWIASWLGPHWLIDISEPRKRTHYRDAVISIQLVEYPNRRPGPVIYQGLFSDLFNTESAFDSYTENHKDRKEIMRSHRIAQKLYGEAIPTLGLDGRQGILFHGLVEIGHPEHSEMQPFLEHNDQVLRNMILRIGSMSDQELRDLFTSVQEKNSSG